MTQAQKWDKDPDENVDETLQLEANYKYDVYGNRIEKTVDDDGDTTVDTTERYALDGWKPGGGFVGNENWDVWADLDGNDDLQTRYLRGDMIDQVFARIEDDAGGDLAYWLLTDRQGSVREVVDNSGDVVDSIDYDGYGNISNETDSSYRGRYAYTGRELDVETGLQYNRARYYDGATGRWTSQDPLGFDAGDSNLYRYVSNQPLSLSDPSGLEPDMPWGSINKIWSGVLSPASKEFKEKFKKQTGHEWKTVDVRVYASDYYTPNDINSLKKSLLQPASNFYNKFGVEIRWDVRRIKTPDKVCLRTETAEPVGPTARGNLVPHPYAKYLDSFDTLKSEDPKDIPDLQWFKNNFDQNVNNVFLVDDVTIDTWYSWSWGVSWRRMAWVEDYWESHNVDTIFTHEIGHIFGLIHEGGPNNLMKGGQTGALENLTITNQQVTKMHNRLEEYEQ